MRFSHLLKVTGLAMMLSQSAFGGHGTWPFILEGQAQSSGSSVAATAHFSAIGDTVLEQTAALACQNPGSVDLFSASGSLAVGNRTYTIKGICDAVHSSDVEIIAERVVGAQKEAPNSKGKAKGWAAGGRIEMQGTLPIGNSPGQAFNCQMWGILKGKGTTGN